LAAGKVGSCNLIADERGHSEISPEKSTMDYALSFTRLFLVNDNALVGLQGLETGRLVSYSSAMVIPDSCANRYCLATQQKLVLQAQGR
jgi:hypothetical protein